MTLAVRPLSIWLACVGEPLPTDPGEVRLLRVGLLADALAARGHQVTWWTSTFDHSHKRQRAPASTAVDLGNGTRLRLLHGTGYRTNVSLKRFVDHWTVARAFRAQAPLAPRPDVIFAAMPTVELAAEATTFARARAVPIALDIRDLWPDVIVDALPAPLRPVGRAALFPLRRRLTRALHETTGIVGISASYLRWGLERAGRAAGPFDRCIPLGYPDPGPVESAPEDAGALLRAMGIDPALPFLWFIGSFGHYYDLATVIDVARRLASSGVRVQFVLSGAGDREAEWRARAAGLDNVRFTGWVDGERLRALQRSAWAGLAAYVPGAPQSLPNKLLEYLAGGLPVLSSLGEDARELLATHRCGLSYAAGNRDELEHAVRQLLADPALHGLMSENSRALFEREFAEHRVFPALAGYLESLARTATGQR